MCINAGKLPREGEACTVLNLVSLWELRDPCLFGDFPFSLNLYNCSPTSNMRDNDEQWRETRKRAIFFFHRLFFSQRDNLTLRSIEHLLLILFWSRKSLGKIKKRIHVSTIYNYFERFYTSLSIPSNYYIINRFLIFYQRTYHSVHSNSNFNIRYGKFVCNIIT